jgi:probable phosphoglycerate mutase
MIRLVALRHGKTEWNAQRRLQGRNDIPLSDEGVAQVTGWIIPLDLSGFDWVCSPLARARETARLLGGTPRVEEALMEMSWGEWEGLRFEELKRQGGEGMRENLARGLDFRPDGGESPRDVMQRLAPWLKTLQTPTVAVCHKGVLQALYALATGWDMVARPEEKLRDDKAHLFHVEDGAIKIKQMNIPLDRR